MEDRPVVLAQGSLDELRAIARSLSQRGIDCELLQPPEGQGSS